MKPTVWRDQDSKSSRDGRYQRGIFTEGDHSCLHVLSLRHSAEAAAKAEVQTVRSQGKKHPKASQKTVLRTHTGPGRVPVST